MLAIEFPGSTRLIEELDNAVRNDCTTAITDALRQALCRLMRDQAVNLPACVYQAAADHYARREIYRSEDLGYSVNRDDLGTGPGHCPARSLRNVVRRRGLARADRGDALRARPA